MLKDEEHISPADQEGGRHSLGVLRLAREHKKLLVLAFSTVFFALFVFYLAVYRAPSTFIAGALFHVEQGETLTEVSGLLEEEGLIRSAFWLRNSVIVLGGERDVIAGDYFFSQRKTLGGIAYALVKGEFGLVPVKVTFPEGTSSVQMARILEGQLGQFDVFDAEEFIKLAADKEGYLFPDTYFFMPTVNAQVVVQILRDTFDEKIESLREEIEATGRGFEDVLIMASIVEREARITESRRIIAGILWKRLDEDIPLQVDVTFAVINGKNSFDLTLEDLDIDSPFNTYKYRGLPPAPITNPGLAAIRATITPLQTDYYYFLADREGITYYSRTFEEHKQNKARYLQ